MLLVSIRANFKMDTFGGSINQQTVGEKKSDNLIPSKGETQPFQTHGQVCSLPKTPLNKSPFSLDIPNPAPFFSVFSQERDFSKQNYSEQPFIIKLDF